MFRQKLKTCESVELLWETQVRTVWEREVWSVWRSEHKWNECAFDWKRKEKEEKKSPLSERESKREIVVSSNGGTKANQYFLDIFKLLSNLNLNHSFKQTICKTCYQNVFLIYNLCFITLIVKDYLYYNNNACVTKRELINRA